ncbi:MAG TPA: DUF6531 domain-containing protein, partial [Pseudonocardiaceae bacterium]|nr:DUF6531 domain-containing protein [Pseudonocardiaceae bacterium]
MAGGGSGFRIRPGDLHGSGSKLSTFGDQLTQGGQKLQSTGERLTSHASGDRSGFGAAIAKAFGRGMDVTGKVFGEGGRVIGGAGKRLHANADSHVANENRHESAFKSIHDKGAADTRPRSTTPGSGPSTGHGSSGNSGSTHNGSGPHRPKNPQDTATPAGNRNCKSDPVDVATGDVVTVELDLELPGALPLLLERTHISSYRAGRLFGASWAATVDQRLEIDDEGVCYFAPDGLILVYPTPTAEQPVLPAAGPRWPLTVDPSGGHTLAVGDRTLHFGTRTGARAQIVELDAITGPGDQRIDVERDQQGIPTVLRHSAGYLVALHTEHGRITELHVLGTDVDVLVLRYGYDERGRLVELVNS